MELSREQQAQFTRELMPLLEQVTDPRALEQLHKIAALVLAWSGFEDNGMAFAVSEYSFELAETAKGESGKSSQGWAESARASVERELAASGIPDSEPRDAGPADREARRTGRRN